MVCYLLIVAGFIALVLANDQESYEKFIKYDPNALYNPNLLEGDMLEHPNRTFPSSYNVLSDVSILWPNSELVYAFAQGQFSGQEEQLIKSAMQHIEQNSCVRFKYYNGEQNYVLIQKRDGCYSAIGRVGGQQPLSLGNGCGRIGIAIHEFLHALGFTHHHSRSDRDEYLTIYWQNMNPQMRLQFEKLQPQENTLYTNFDYNSIMMYGSHAFSANGQPTMLPKQSGVQIGDPGQKSSMSEADLFALKALYGCNKESRPPGEDMQRPYERPERPEMPDRPERPTYERKTTQQPDQEGVQERTPAPSGDCKGIGNYPVAGDCHKFIQCFPSFNNRDLRRFEMTCAEGTAFEPKMGICTHEHLVKC